RRRGRGGAGARAPGPGCAPSGGGARAGRWSGRGFWPGQSGAGLPRSGCWLGPGRRRTAPASAAATARWWWPGVQPGWSVRGGRWRPAWAAADGRSVLIETVPDRLAGLGPLFADWTRELEALSGRYTDADLRVITDFLTESARRQKAATARLTGSPVRDARQGRN